MSEHAPSLHIVHLYPQHMNLYGDWGNVLTLVRRGQWHGYEMRVSGHNPGDVLPDQVDLVVGGGGPDSGQVQISHDLLGNGQRLRTWADDDVPMVMICGMCQLFGHYFQPVEGLRMEGIGVFDAHTHGADKRMIGNTVVRSAFGELIGFENHSGQTTLAPGQAALGQVIQGAGNNGYDGAEGAVYRQVYGSYLHGSLLPNNPVCADALLQAAAMRKYGTFTSRIADDHLAQQARTLARKRAY